MAEDKESAAANKPARAKFKGISTDQFVNVKTRDKYAEVSGKPDFIMISYVRLTGESIEEIDTYILQEDKAGSGMILTSHGDRINKARKLIESIGGEMVGK